MLNTVCKEPEASRRMCTERPIRIAASRLGSGNEAKIVTRIVARFQPSAILGPLKRVQAPKILRCEFLEKPLQLPPPNSSDKGESSNLHEIHTTQPFPSSILRNAPLHPLLRCPALPHNRSVPRRPPRLRSKPPTKNLWKLPSPQHKPNMKR